MTVTLSEAAETLGVYQSALSRWIIAGLVQPEGWTRTRGEPLGITERELREFAVVRDLRGAGVSMQAIRRASRYYARSGRTRLVVDGLSR